jgi:hypothetical protein
MLPKSCLPIESARFEMEQRVVIECDGPRRQGPIVGVVDSEAEKQAARVAAELVEGVKAIENNVTVLPVVAGS